MREPVPPARCQLGVSGAEPCVCHGEGNFLALCCCRNPNLEGVGVLGAGTLRTALWDAGLRRPDRGAQPRVIPEVFQRRDLGFMKLFSRVSSLTPKCREILSAAVKEQVGLFSVLSQQ